MVLTDKLTLAALVVAAPDDPAGIDLGEVAGLAKVGHRALLSKLDSPAFRVWLADRHPPLARVLDDRLGRCGVRPVRAGEG